MKIGRRYLPLALGLAMAMCFGLFAGLASITYHGSYGPWSDNTLSQLGNSHLNPAGSGTYRIGCLLTGLFAVVFFLSVDRWRKERTGKQRLLVAVVMALGVVGGIGVFMNGVFPETSYAIHHAWAGVVFNGFGAAMLIAPFALWRGGLVSIVISGYCGLATVAVVLMFVFAGHHWVEWLPVALFLGFPSIVAWLMLGDGERPSSLLETAEGERTEPGYPRERGATRASVV